MIAANNKSFADKTGIPMSLLWGYVGILIFMMGDGMETGWLSPYLKSRGLSVEDNANLFTAYGVTVAISAAQQKAQVAAQEQLGKVTGGLNLPFKLPFG